LAGFGASVWPENAGFGSGDCAAAVARSAAGRIANRTRDVFMKFNRSSMTTLDIHDHDT
jgi:hypothetical protein